MYVHTYGQMWLFLFSILFHFKIPYRVYVCIQDRVRSKENTLIACMWLGEFSSPQSLPQMDQFYKTADQGTYLCSQEAQGPRGGEACSPSRPGLCVVRRLVGGSAGDPPGAPWPFTCQWSNQKCSNSGGQGPFGQQDPGFCPCPFSTEPWKCWLPAGIWQTHYEGFVTLFKPWA